MADYQDPKGWLENAFNTVMGLRKLPQNIGLDAARNLLGLSAGGLLRDPGKYTSSALENIGQSAKATIDPVTSAIQRARQSALQSLDAEPMEGSGTTPTAGGALPIDYRAPDAGPALSPAPSRRVPRGLAPSAPVAAGVQSDIPPIEEVDAFPPYRAPMAPAAAPAPAPTQPRQSYADMFKEILAQKQAKLEAPLTDEQKRALELQFFLGMMSNSSKPGARIFGAMGDAGQTTLAAQQGMQKENLNRAEKERANQLETAYKMLGVRNLDDDNQARQRQMDLTEKHYATESKRYEQLDARDKERIDLLRKQLEQGKWKIQDTADGFIKIDAETGNTVPLLDNKGKPIKPYRKPEDNRPAEVRLIEYMMKNPEAMTQWEKMNARKEGAITQRDLLGAWKDVMKERAPNEQQPFDAWAKGVLGGRSDTKPDPVANKGRVWIDDTTKERFKSDGKIWVKVK